MGKNTVQANQCLFKCYSNSAPTKTTVKRWYTNFKHGCTDTNDTERSGHPNSTVVPENTKKTPQNRFGQSKIKIACDSRWVEDIRRQHIHNFAWKFVNEKALFKVGGAFAHSRLKTTC